MTNNQVIAGNELATVFSRFIAMVIDSIVLVIPIVLSNFAVPIVGPLILGLFYFPVFESSPLQATLGKKAMGIMVISTAGKRLTFGSALLRFVVESGSACVLFLGHFVVFFSQRKQALHDLVADSLVVKGTKEGVPVLDAWVDTIKHVWSRLSEDLGGAKRRERLDE